jgi:hypothetical protein
MKTREAKPFQPFHLPRLLPLTLVMFFVTLTSRGADTERLFTSLEKAVAALAAAAKSGDREAIRGVFGLGADELLNPDVVQATNELAAFNAAFDQAHRLVAESATRQVLEVGTNQWPFPVQLVRQGGAWHFDLAAGRTELLNRRIGRNEYDTLDACRAYVQAQREYASRDRAGDGVLEYAQRIGSTPGSQDGLYWPAEPGQGSSPFGPLVAAAQAEGYGTPSTGDERQPFHGYYFKILTRQGRSAPGGKYDFIINGNMIGGFALVAWPASYGETGVMTFVVNQQGRVFQKDLGPKTARLAPAMKEYNPDASWILSPN